MREKPAETWQRTWEQRRGSPEPAWRFIFDEISRHLNFKGKDVLELGCGTGSLSYFALRAGAHHATLVDFSETALRLARQVLQSMPREKVSYVQANLLGLNLRSKFDIVMSSGLVEHFAGQRLEACLRQHAGHSRDFVVVCCPSDTVFNRRRSSSPQNIEKYGFQRPIPDQEMRKLFERQGLTLIHNRRFRISYGVNLPGDALPGTDRVCRLAFNLMRPFERWLGGLLLTIGRGCGERFVRTPVAREPRRRL